MKKYRNAFMDESIEKRRDYLAKLNNYFLLRLNARLRKLLGMVYIGFDEAELLEMRTTNVLEGLDYIEKWLPLGYKAKMERARKIMWNYYKIQSDIFEEEIGNN